MASHNGTMFTLAAFNQVGPADLVCAGEIDLHNADVFGTAIDALAPSDSVVTIDMRDVAFMDSAAIVKLVRYKRQRGGGDLRLLVRDGSLVLRVLMITQFVDLFDVVVSD